MTNDKWQITTYTIQTTNYKPQKQVTKYKTIYKLQTHNTTQRTQTTAYKLHNSKTQNINHNTQNAHYKPQHKHNNTHIQHTQYKHTTTIQHAK